jgi:raffinose/stachyose/melibiose transport system substrate-binding protein
MKKILSLAVATCMIAGLMAGCGDKPVSEEKTTTVVEKTSAPEVKTEEQKATVKFASFQVREKEKVDACKADFESKNPNITIDINYIPNEQYNTVIKTKLAAGDNPDALTTWAGADTNAMISAGYLMNLSDLEIIKKVFPSVTPMVKNADGGIYMLPMGVAGMGAIVNNKVLKDCGVEAVPTNYTEFLAACEKIKAKGIAPIAFAEKDGVSTEMFGGLSIEQFITDQDAKDLMSGAKKPSQIEGIKTAWTRVKELKDKGYFIDSYSGVTYDQGLTLIGQGKAAFIAAGEWALGGVKKVDPNVDISLIPIPMADDKSKPIVFITSGVSISKETKVKDAAIKWLEYNGSTEYANIYKPEWAAPIEGVTAPVSKEDIEFTKNYSAMFTPEKSGSYGFPNWKDTRVKPLQELLLSNNTIEKVLEKADSIFTAK